MVRLFFIALLCCLALGCGPTGPSAPSASVPSAAALGQFEGEVVAVWDADGRNMTLRQDFAYIDGQGRRWLAPANSVVNGASIPQGFWSVIGGPFEGRYRNASVIHDVGCHDMNAAWEDVHQMFYEACLCGGVDETQAKMMYYAVYHFGPRWQKVTETQVEMRPTINGPVPEAVAVQLVVRNDPVPPTPDEIAQVTEFVDEDKPTLASLQNTTRDALHQRPRRHHSPGRDGSKYSRSQQPRGEWPGSYQQKRPQAPAITNGELVPRGAEYNARGGSPDKQDISPREEEWAIGFVRVHLEQQAGAPVPAQFHVRRIPSGYLVFVQYLQYDEQGQVTLHPGGRCLVRLSSKGEVLEVKSGQDRNVEVGR